MHIIILAAGHGKRMGSVLPKPLVPLCGKPIIAHLLDSIKKSGVCEKPTIVVSPDNIDLFKEKIGDDYNYVIQEKQLGTGHATFVAHESINGSAKQVLVLPGDAPWVSAETIKKIYDDRATKGCVLTLATTVVPDFEDDREGFYNFGRIVRGDDGHVTKIIEKEDATEEELAIKEVNPAYMSFDAQWLWSHLEKLKSDNAQEEYYLTDLVQMAVDEGEKISAVQIDHKEAHGINTKEQLALCESLAG